MLAREFGEWPMLVRAPKKASIYGSGGSAYIDPNDVVGIYKIKGGEFDGKFLVADEKGSWTLASPDEVKQAFGFAPENAPVLKADQNLTAHIQHARAWATYLQNWQMPQYIDGLTDQNGQPVDLRKFFTDRNYAVKVVSYYLQNPHIRHDGKIIPFRRRTNKDPNRIVDALYALYYGMRFDPDVNLFGVTDGGFWFNNKMKILDDDVKVGNEWFYPPYLDDRGDVHSNIDTILAVSNRSSLVLYNPFTKPVKVKDILLWYDRRKFGSLRQAYEAGGLNASVKVIVATPAKKQVFFYFGHLDGSKGSVLDELLKTNGFDPLLRGVFDFNAKGAAVYKIYVNGRMSIKPGEKIATLDNPKNDPWSLGWHTEFGFYPRVEDYRIATLMATAMLYHPNPEQYLPPLPPVPEQGYWFGKKHVVSYQPTVPAIAVKQPNGTIAFANINPRKRPSRLASQLSAYERISGRNPARALRRRQKFIKPKHYA